MARFARLLTSLGLDALDVCDVQVDADLLRLRQVMLNLIVNALRHSRSDDEVALHAARDRSR